MTPKRRARNLTDKDIKEIVEILDGWTAEDLSWARLVDEVAKRKLCTYVKQALHKHERIRNAFEITKERLPKTKVAVARKVSPEVQILLDRKARLEAKIERLEAENNRLLEQIVLFQRNAYVRGLTEADLTQPLPSVDRKRTKNMTLQKSHQDRKK